jgi:hypothetical protein
MTTTAYQNGPKPKSQAFDGLNVVALYDVLADILGDAHGAKIKYTVKKKEEARA